jgi:hypothetical protein
MATPNPPTHETPVPPKVTAAKALAPAGDRQRFETRRQRLYRLAAQLKNVRSTYDAHYRELSDNFFPRRTRFFEQDINRGDRRYGKIINPAGPLAARTLRSGMMTGITSPARPWRRLTTPDPDLAEFGPVKEWLFAVNKRMTTIDLRSNLYNVLPTLYGDCAVFGTGCFGLFDDDEDLIRCYPFPVGSYWLATDNRGVVDTFYREMVMTVRQVVEKFGDESAGEAQRWAKFSTAVRGHWDAGNYELPIIVVHWIIPNTEADETKLGARYKPFYSCYYEQGVTGGPGVQSDVGWASANQFLRESGFDRFPVLAPRWDVTGEDVYGTDCPGMQGLGDAKELQVLERKRSKALEKQLNPPLQGPTSLRNQKASLLAGDITYVDEREGKGGLRPVHETNLSVKDVTESIREKEHNLSRTFYEDLFLMLQQMEGIQPRNTAEIAERHEEKLLVLGQTLERMNDELLDPLTDLEFDKMLKAGLIPPAPPELQGQDLRVEYISIMAQAQKLVGVAGLERFSVYVASLAKAQIEAQQPVTVFDKVDLMHMIDDYGDAMGVSAKTIVPDDVFQQIQQQKQQAAAAQQKLAAAEQASKAAANLAGADMSGDNALTRLVPPQGAQLPAAAPV